MTFVSLGLLLLVAQPIAYLLVLALASLFPGRLPPLRGRPTTRFVIAIAAHDEERVIGATVRAMLALDYPRALYEVHVVADHCTDATAELATAAGARAHARDEGRRGGKADALRWLWDRIPDAEGCDAVVIFDADTRVSPDFLRVMDAHIAAGVDIIQGRHVISNPESGWFAAITWAKFIVDNRFQNAGRVRLGWSAKHMGDSICFRRSSLARLGWGEGLADDHSLRARILLAGGRITYDPRAVGSGEAPSTWARAEAQRRRWMRGVVDVRREMSWSLFRAALAKRDLRLLDGALELYLPTYSSLTLACGVTWLGHVGYHVGVDPVFSAMHFGGWGLLLLTLLSYPLLGLFLERAPLRAYMAVCAGPVYVLWRTWLAMTTKLSGRAFAWVRTEHGD